jgi:thiosulfate/3-mercaptopyruvate sulfurtransferase
MKKLFLLFALWSTAALASPRASLVVDAAWLKAHLGDPNLVLLHVGDKDEYAKQHIPGARLVAQQDVSVSEHSEKGLMLELPPAEDLRTRLENLGISDRSRVVVYYGKDWVSPSTRIILTLDHAGVNASLLNGGMPEWVRRGGTVTDAATPARKGKLSALKTKQVTTDAAFVRAHLKKPGFKIIDARAPVFYDGTETGGMHQKDKTGHIAGAGSVPFTSIVDDNNLLLSPAQLEALFAKAGVKKGDTIVTYCHIGQQATATLFAARTLGYKTLLYDGSFQDWSRIPDSPVEVK